MKSRHLVAAGALAVAAIGVIWYLSLAPSRGSSVAPGPDSIALTATQMGTGSWVRYLVNVKNLGDAEYDGDVLLVNRSDSGQAKPGAAPLPYSRVAPAGAGTVGTAAVPAVAPDSAYKVHVAIASRQQATLSFFAPPDYGVVEARDDSDQPIAGVQVDRSDGVPIAVLSDSETAADQLVDLKLGELPLTVFSFQHGRGFPSDASLLAGYVTIVLDQFNSGSLSRDQQRALLDFVGLGGNLVLVGGSSWRQTVLPLPADLTPVRPTSTAGASMAPVAALAGHSGDVQAPVAEGTVRKGARSALAENSLPLVAEAGYGAGLVVQLAFDPAAAPLAGTPVATDAWTQALTRGLAMPPGAGPPTHTLLGPESLPLDLFPPAADSPLPSPWLVGPLLAAYLLVVGPANYLVLRQRLHRPSLVWISTPLIAVLFAGSFYTIGSRLQGTLRDDEVQLIKVAPPGTVSSFEYNQVLFPSRGDHQLQAARGALMAPLTLRTYQDFAGTCDRCLVQLAGVQIGEEHVQEGPQPSVLERGVAYGSVRIVGTASVQHRTAGVASRLSVSGGHLKGTLVNLGSGALRNLAVFGYDGVNYQRIPLPDLPPGATVTVDSAPESVGASTLPPGVQPSQSARDDVIENAIAMAALAQSPQPVLVGYTELAPGRLLVDGAAPRRLGLAAFEQPLSVEAADGMLADWSRVRLAAIGGDSRRGYTDVYDIEVPAGAGSFQLAYDGRQYGSAQLFDWATGSWRAAQAGSSQESGVHVDAGLIQDGVVRVRVNELRVTWGTGFRLPG